MRGPSPAARAAGERPEEALPLRSALLTAPPAVDGDARRRGVRRRAALLLALAALGALPVLAVALRWLPTEGPGRALYLLHDHVLLPLLVGPFERAHPWSGPVAIWLAGALLLAAVGWVRSRSIFHALQVALTRRTIGRPEHQAAIRRFATRARRFGLTGEQLERITRHDERAQRERVARQLEAGRVPAVASLERLERLAALAAHLEATTSDPRRRLATAAELHRALLWIERARRAGGEAGGTRTGDAADALRALCTPPADAAGSATGPFAARLLLHDLSSLCSGSAPPARALRLGLRERRRVLAEALHAVERARDAGEATRAGDALPAREPAELAIGVTLDVAARLAEPEQARSLTSELEALTVAATLAGVDAPWLDALRELPAPGDRRLLAELLAERDRQRADELAAIAARGRTLLGEADLRRLGEEARLERMAAGERATGDEDEDDEPGAPAR